MAKKKNALWKYWGYIALLLVFGGWVTKDIGPAILLLGSVLCTFYFLFQAPMWCGALTRQNEYCRNNSYGLLVGCAHRQHKWQSMTMLVDTARWSHLARKTMHGIGSSAATISALAATVSALVALITLLIS